MTNVVGQFVFRQFFGEVDLAQQILISATNFSMISQFPTKKPVSRTHRLFE
jgi:hypothetical protein